MIVKFLVDVDDGKAHSVAISCQAQWTVKRAVMALRRRIALPQDALVSIRLNDGSPVPPERNMRSLAVRSVHGTLQLATTLHAIVDVESHLISSLKLRRRVVSDVHGAHDNSSSSSAGDDDFNGEQAHADGQELHSNHVTNDYDSLPSQSVSLTRTQQQQHRNNVKRRKAFPDTSTTTSLDDETTATEDIVSYSSDISEETERLVRGIGIHTITVNYTGRKAYATKETTLGDTVVHEQPILVVAYPQQIVEAVRSHDKLRGMSYNAAFRASSTIAGLDDDAYARYLSIGMTHSLHVSTRNRFETQVVLFPDITACRHSCAPNTSFSRSVDVFPFSGMLRCAVRKGVDAGDEVTFLYPSVDRREFVMLPRDRRERWMRRVHYLREDEYCGCSRCWKAGRDVFEQAITGAFFSDGATATEREASSAAMRQSFDALHVLDELQVVLDLDGAIKRLTNNNSSREGNQQQQQQGAAVSRSSTAAEALVTKYRVMCRHASEILSFLAAHTRRVSPNDDDTTSHSRQRSAIELHVFHWRLSLLRLRLLDVYAWLLDHKVDARRAFTAVKKTQELEDRSLPAVPFCKGVFDAALDQLNTESALLSRGHPMILTTWRLWRRLMGEIPEKLAAGVQQRSLSQQWCPHVDWETIALADRVFPLEAATSVERPTLS